MNVWIDCYAPLIGRVFMGGFFLWNGIQAALNLPAAAAMFAAHGLPYGSLLAMAVVVVEVVGGIAIIIGVYTRYAALMLTLYLVLQAGFLTNFNDDGDLNRFVLNLGIIGGLLYISTDKNRPWG